MFRGNNLLTLNTDTVKDALEEYINGRLAPNAPKISVTGVTESNRTMGLFEVSISPATSNLPPLVSEDQLEEDNP